MKKVLLFVSVVAIGTHVASCSKNDPAPAPVANFTYAGANLPAPATVTFTSTSTNATSYAWDFGDNSTSTLQNPTHTYTMQGVYAVKLTATGTGGSASTTKSVNIVATPTKVRISKVTITAMPFIDPNANGAGWDPSDGPDVFYEITDDVGTYLLGNYHGIRIYDLTQSMLPTGWTFTTPPYEVTDLTITQNIKLWDFDATQSNNLIGNVSFTFTDYTTGATPYPTSVTKTNGSVTIKLDITWQ